MDDSIGKKTVADDEEMLLVDIVAILLKRNRIILLITLLGVFFSVGYSVLSQILPPEKSFLPNVYSPKATVAFSSNNGGGLSSLLGDAAGFAALAGVNVGVGKSNGQLAVVIAKSNTTLDELNAEFNFTSRYKIKTSPKSATRKAILKNLAIANDEKTGTLTIAFTDINPVFAQAVVNRTVEILDRRFASLGGNKAIEQKTRLEAKLTDVQTQIAILEEKLKAFTAKYGVIDIEALATEQVTVLAKLRSELILKDMESENYEKFSKVEDPVIRRLRSERESISSKIREIEGGGSVLPSQKAIPQISFEYAALKRDLMVQMEILKLLTQQYEMAKLNAEGQEPVFQVLELAEVPDQKSGPSRGMICIVVTMASFLSAILFAFIIEAVAKIRNDPELMKKFRGKPS